MEKFYEVYTILGEYIGILEGFTDYHEALIYAKWYYDCNDIYITDATDEIEE